MNAFLKDAESGVCLRPLEKKNAKKCAKWLNDQRNRRFLIRNFPLSIKTEEEWIEGMYPKQEGPLTNMPFLILYKKEPVGVVGLHKINWVWRSAEIGICVGVKKKRHRGIGTVAYNLLIDYAFKELSLSVVEAEVYGGNEPSLKFHQSLGFKQTGRSDPKVPIGGQLVPVVYFSMTKKRWRKRHS